MLRKIQHIVFAAVRKWLSENVLVQVCNSWICTFLFSKHLPKSAHYNIHEALISYDIEGVKPYVVFYFLGGLHCG